MRLRPNPILATKVRIINPEDFDSPNVIRDEETKSAKLKRLFRRETAAQFIGEVTPGFHIFGLSKGQFSLVDVIQEVSDQIGLCDFALSVWTVASADLGKLRELLNAQRFTRIRFLLDFSFQRRQPALIAHVRELFGNGALVVTKNHCKFALFGNERWKITCRTSMNLNFNPRLEDVELKDDPKLYGFLNTILDEIFTKTNCKRQATDSSLALAREFAALEI